MSLREHVSLREHACVSSRGAQSTELVWILDFKQILLLLLLLLADVGLKFERAEMHMIRWMCSISLKDRRTNEELRWLVGVEPITTFIRSGRLSWYGHVMRKGYEDWVKKCMESRVAGRRPVGIPRKTWLQSVEEDMAELEIDKEDVHDRSK